MQTSIFCSPKHYCNRKRRYLLVLALMLNISLFMYFAFIQNKLPIDGNISFNGIKKDDPITFTLFMTEFEDFENNLKEDILHLKKVLDKKLRLFIISDKSPYPPLKLNFTDNVQFINTGFDVNRPAYVFENFIGSIDTDIVMFLPDFTRIVNVSNFYVAMENLLQEKHAKALAISTGGTKLTCPGFQIDRKRWTVSIEDFSGTEGYCDFIDGEQVIMLRTKDFKQLASPFSRPTHYSLYFQLALRRWKSIVFHKPIFKSVKSLEDPMKQYQHKQLEKSRLHATFKKFGIHQIVLNRNKHEYFGCNKDTERCFASVINDVPDYIYQNKWTPPCCLKAIRETGIHVFNILEKNSVRYWLEGGSLLGAARNKDIIPWDYDIDIGIYEEDIPKCQEILKAKEKHYLDDEGFLWEKGIEGDFFRVHYSDINRNHVDIFPFYSKDGTMTKNTWFKSHPQDREFPEHFLKPLTNIHFIGRNVSAPNNVKAFLELKFGQGVIENPKYPNAQSVF